MTDQPTPSATVIVLDKTRGQGEPFGVLFLERGAGAKFMPGRFVFPGGAVEPHDGDEPMSMESMAVCAARELWEEAGLILASPARAAADADPAQAEALRLRLRQGQASLSQALAALGLAPALAGLRPYARWITPRARSRRFDTIFFLAPAPEGQTASADNAEASQVAWLGPREALARNEAGSLPLAPPQVRLVGQLAQADGVEELLARPADLAPVEPVLWAEDGQRVVMLPWDPDHGAGRAVTPARPCHAGQASRLVHLEGRWLPHTAG